jgi:N-acetylglutamate synthase
MNDISILSLEERAFNAWPARQTVFCGGWVFRLSDGLTNRANSANPLAPASPFSEVKTAAEEFYTRRSLPTVFRLSPLADDQADHVLEVSGYTFCHPAIVMVGPTLNSKRVTNVTVSAFPDLDWLDGVANAKGLTGNFRESHDILVSSISLPVAFATARDRHGPLGYGFAVIDRGMAGLFDVIVLSAAQGRGYGAMLASALLKWAHLHGASRCYLQVAADNLPTIAMLSKGGFREVYRYHYRIRS